MSTLDVQPASRMHHAYYLYEYLVIVALLKPEPEFSSYPFLFTTGSINNKIFSKKKYSNWKGYIFFYKLFQQLWSVIWIQFFFEFQKCKAEIQPNLFIICWIRSPSPYSPKNTHPITSSKIPKIPLHCIIASPTRSTNTRFGS